MNSPDPPLKLLYLGLGEMGYHISGFFSKHFETTVWNRTYSVTQKHQEHFKTKGLTGSNPFLHDISQIDLIFSCLPTSKEVEQYADLLIQSNPKRKPTLVWVDNTSGHPAHSKKIALKLESAQVGFLDAPVSGGRSGASSGQLAVMVGGKTENFLRAERVLKKVSKYLAHISEEVGSGDIVKAYNNLLFGCNFLVAMKVGQLLEARGINLDKALKSILNGSGGSACMGMIHTYMTNNRTINYNAKTAFLIKDMNIALDQAGLSADDPVGYFFNSAMEVYKQASKGRYEHDLLEVFDFVERKPKI